MKVCKACGKAMDDSYNTCPYCGAAYSDSQSEQFNRNAADNAEPNMNNAQNAYNPNNAYNPQNTYNPQGNPYGQNPPFGNNRQYAQNVPHYNNVNTNTDYTPAPRPQRSAYIAAILAFTLGAFGVHNFYLDKKNRALTQLLVSLIGSVFTLGIAAIVIEIWAIIEGIKILKGEINTDGTGTMIKMSF